MHRRTFIASTAIGSTSLVAGCIGHGTSRAPAATISRIVTLYPSRNRTPRSLYGEPTEAADEDTTSFEGLSERARREVANAIARERYVTDVRPAFDRSGPVRFQGETFHVGTVGSFRLPPGASESEPTPWRPDVAVTAEIAGNDLTVTASNNEAFPIGVRHFGRPYFGVLTAAGPSTRLLQHDGYESNEYIRTDGVIHTESPRGERETNTLATGASLAETYEFPAAETDGAIIWFTIPLARDSTEPAQQHRVTMRVRIYLDD